MGQRGDTQIVIACNLLQQLLAIYGSEVSQWGIDAAPNYLKVTTVEGRSQEHRKPVDGIADGWNGSCFEQAAGMCSDEVERMDPHIGGTKGSESVKNGLPKS